jgi:hypothetical protein
MYNKILAFAEGESGGGKQFVKPYFKNLKQI